MSNPPSVLPPNPYFNGIIYNPTDYLSISGNTVLTYAQASVLFIQKTIADTVTGITDFVNGITTSSILAKTVAATCNLWTNATALINIGSATSTTNLNGGINLARNATGTNPTYIECVSGTVNQYMDWHCNSANNIDYDCRFIASNGTSTIGNGDMSFQGKSFSLSCPLTLSYAPSLLTGTDNLGYNSIPSANPTNACANTDTVIRTIALTQGVWLVQGSLIWSPVTLGQLYAGISPSSVIDNICVTSAVGNGANNPYVSLCRYMVIPSNTTVNLIGRSFSGASTIQLSSLNATRIG